MTPISNEDVLNKNLVEYLPEFFEALKDRIVDDDARWGDTWKERGLLYNGESQELRFYHWLMKQFDDYWNYEEEFPWLKVAGEAFIGYIRDKYLRRTT